MNPTITYINKSTKSSEIHCTYENGLTIVLTCKPRWKGWKVFINGSILRAGRMTSAPPHIKKLYATYKQQFLG